MILAEIARWAEKHFWRRSVHRSTSSGTVHAYLPVVLDDTGKLGASLIDFTNDVQAKDATLTSIAALGTTADKTLYTTAIDTWAETPLTTFGRSLIDDTNAAAARTTLDAQQLDAELTAIAGLTSATDRVAYFSGLGTAALATFTAAGRALVDDADAAAQRTTLGLGTMALEAATAFLRLLGVAGGQTAYGGTAASDALTLSSTAHATKGKVIFGAAGAAAFDEVNTRLGVGTNAPTEAIEAYNATASVRINATRGNGATCQMIGGASTGVFGTTTNHDLALFANGAEQARITTTARLGIDAASASPQGSLHIHDNTGGLMFVTKTDIVGAAQTIIANAAGDVTKVLWGQVLVHDGTTVAVANLSMTPGGANVDVVADTVTLRFTIAAAGNLTVIRQAGAGTGVCAFFGFWL